MSSYYFILLAICFFIKANADTSPPIAYITKENSNQVGDTVSFLCSLAAGTKYPVEWLKVPEKNAKESEPINDERISQSSEPESDDYYLTIRGIQVSDEGWYRCQARLPDDKKVTADAHLKVEQPPFFFDNSTNAVEVKVGEGLQLECYAGGKPTPKVSWRRQNNELLPGGHSIYEGNILRVDKARTAYRGTYYCIAENGVGSKARRVVQFEVQSEPTVNNKYSGVGQVRGKSADLSCSVRGYPSPAITWWKDGVQISTGEEYSISHFQSDSTVVDTSLRVKIASDATYGEYTCKATNAFGSDQATTEFFDSSERGTAVYWSMNGGHSVMSCLTLLLTGLAFTARYF